MTQAQATSARLKLLRRIEALQQEGKWDREAFHAALQEAIAIREAVGEVRSSLEWLYNEARSEWLEGILIHDSADLLISQDD
jgi:hypothetical protein